MPAAVDFQKNLRALDQRIKLTVSANELRVLIGCLRAVVYQMQADDEPYLDSDGLALKTKLESLYKKSVNSE